MGQLLSSEASPPKHGRGTSSVITGLLSRGNSPRSGNGTNNSLKFNSIDLSNNRLQFKVHLDHLKARNIRKVDAYLTIQFEGYELLRTKTKDRDMNPKWEEHFNFMYELNGGLEALDNKYVTVKVCTPSSIYRETVLGSAMILLKDIANGPIHLDYQIKDSRNKDAGRVAFNCHIAEVDKWSIELKTVMFNMNDASVEDYQDTKDEFKIRYMKSTSDDKGREKELWSKNSVHLINSAVAQAAFVGVFHEIEIEENKVNDMLNISEVKGLEDLHHVDIEKAKNKITSISPAVVSRSISIEKDQKGVKLEKQPSMKRKASEGKSMSDPKYLGDITQALSPDDFPSPESKRSSQRLSALNFDLDIGLSLIENEEKEESSKLLERARPMSVPHSSIHTPFSAIRLMSSERQLLPTLERQLSSEKKYEEIVEEGADSSANTINKKTFFSTPIYSRKSSNEKIDPDLINFDLKQQEKSDHDDSTDFSHIVLSDSMLINTVSSKDVFEITNFIHPISNKEEEAMAFTPKTDRIIKNSILFREDDMEPLVIVGTFIEALSGAIRLQLRILSDKDEDEEGKSILLGECWVNLEKAFSQKHISDNSVEISHDIWLLGLKTGTITAVLKFTNLPHVNQVEGGVLTENGISGSSSVIVGKKKRRFGWFRMPRTEKLPAPIIALEKILVTLETAMSSNGIGMSERRIVVMQRVIELLGLSHKDSILSFVYESRKALHATQKIFLDLMHKMLNYLDIVGYNTKALCFELIFSIWKRAELGDLALLGFDPVNRPKQKFKIDDADIEFAMRAIKELYRCLEFALGKITFKGLSVEARRFNARMLALAAVRIPEFHKEIFQLISAGNSKAVAVEWIGSKYDLDENFESREKRIGPTNDLAVKSADWRFLWSCISEVCDPKVEYAKHLEKISRHGDVWKEKFKKRGHMFYLFTEEYMRMIIDTILMINRDPDWPAIPGYTEIVKSILLEMKRREPVARFTESMLNFTHTLLCNNSLLTSFTKVIFLKSSLHNARNVSSSIEMLDSWLVGMKNWDHQRKAYGVFSLAHLNSATLPITFDFEFFFEAVRRLLDSSVNQIVLKGLEFIYNHWDAFPEKQLDNLRMILLERFYWLFLHWSKMARGFFHHLLVFRILKPRAWSHPQDTEVPKGRGGVVVSPRPKQSNLIDLVDLSSKILRLVQMLQKHSHDSNVPAIVKSKNGFTSANLIEWLLLQNIVLNEHSATALCGELVKYQFLIQIYPEVKSKTPAHSRINSMNIASHFIPSSSTYYSIVTKKSLDSQYIFNVTTERLEGPDPFLIESFAAGLRCIRRSSARYSKNMDFGPLIKNLASNQEFTSYNGVRKAMDASSAAYNEWSKYLAQDNIPSTMLFNSNLSDLDSEKLLHVGLPPEKLLVYAFSSLSEFDALRKKLHDVETALLLGKLTVSSDYEIPVLHWSTVLLDGHDTDAATSEEKDGKEDEKEED